MADKTVVAVENGTPSVDDRGISKPLRLATGVFAAGQTIMFTDEVPQTLVERIVTEKGHGFVKLDTYGKYELWIVASAIDYITSSSATDIGFKSEIRAGGRYWLVSEEPTKIRDIVNNSGGGHIS